MPHHDKPLESSANTKTIVQLHEIPEEYIPIYRGDAPEYPRAQEIQGIFAVNPSAETLMVLYDQKNANRVRSVYQSPFGLNDDARNDPEQTSTVFYHASGEKLVNLVMKEIPMPDASKPLQQSKNVETVVPFCYMPDEYTLIDREDTSDYPRAQEIQDVFAAYPSAQTLMVLYDPKNANRVRSVYQSPARFDDEARNYPEKNYETFYHVSGEKLVNLNMEVACDLSAYGSATMMVPQGVSNEEVRSMARNRAMDVYNWDDPFGFQEEWSTVGGLRINRVVEVVRGPGQNTARNLAQDIPVEGAPSRYGVDIFEMLKSAERGTTISPEVFMYAATRHAQAAGEDFAPEFIENLKTKAQAACENAVYEHMMDSTPLRHDMLALNAGSDDVVEYKAGSVLRGNPGDPVEYNIYRDTYAPSDSVVLASVSDHDVHVLYKDFIGDTQMASIDLASFREQFIQVDQPTAEAALVKHFGYQNHAPVPSDLGMDMNAS